MNDDRPKLKCPNCGLSPPILQNQRSKICSEVRYLGVILDKRLNFKKHIHNTLTKAQRTLSRIYPLMCRYNKLSTENKLILYKMLIRPILTYAAPIWCGISNTDFKRLQIFQNKCLRLAKYRYIWGIPKPMNRKYHTI